MKNRFFFIITLLIITSSVQAEISRTGTIEKVDLKNQYIVISRVQYKIKKGNTKIYSGDHKLGIFMLKQGMDVDFLVADRFVTEIRLTSPYKFNY